MCWTRGPPWCDNDLVTLLLFRSRSMSMSKGTIRTSAWHEQQDREEWLGMKQCYIFSQNMNTKTVTVYDLCTGSPISVTHIHKHHKWQIQIHLICKSMSCFIAMQNKLPSSSDDKKKNHYFCWLPWKIMHVLYCLIKLSFELFMHFVQFLFFLFFPTLYMLNKSSCSS